MGEMEWKYDFKEKELMQSFWPVRKYLLIYFEQWMTVSSKFLLYPLDKHQRVAVLFLKVNIYNKMGLYNFQLFKREKNFT